MTPISQQRLAQITARYEELQAIMASGTLTGGQFAEMSREFSEIEPIAKLATNVGELQEELAELESWLDGDDEELRHLAKDETIVVRAALQEKENKLTRALLPRDTADDRSAVLEIRAGTGGDEAALFAGDLFRMYQGLAADKGWSVELISANSSDAGGYKEVIAQVNGRGVFAQLKFESGVHRVQRVPITESSGRIHTSAATVAILPEPTDVDINIDGKDLRIDTYRASGAGGQHVNKTDSAIRITHEPSGIVVTCQDNKSQHKNRAQALKVLRARLYEAERDAVHNEEAATRKSMVGSGDRSERIRTYNFPQGRVTDHRINLTLHKIDEILTGPGLQIVIDSLITQDEAERLAQINS